MGYTGVPYQIKKGDTLWDIAAEQLGDPSAWPKLYAFNNQLDVIAAGARRIIDPDLIYAGATMRIPVMPGAPRPVSKNKKSSLSKTPMLNLSKSNTSAIMNPAPKIPSPAKLPGQATKPSNLKDQIPRIQMPVSFAYDFKGDPIVIDYGTFIARISQSGRVLINSGNPLPLTLVANGGFETSSKQMAKTAFATLQTETKVSLNKDTLGITFSNKMINSATNIPGPKTQVGIQISKTTGIPVLKVSLNYDELKGQVGANNFVATNYKIEIEIEPKPPQLQPIPIQQPIPSPAPAPKIDWREVAHTATTGALIIAGVVTLAYGASVVFSGGGTSVGAPAYASVMSIILVGGATTSVIAN